MKLIQIVLGAIFLIGSSCNPKFYRFFPEEKNGDFKVYNVNGKYRRDTLFYTEIFRKSSLSSKKKHFKFYNSFYFHNSNNLEDSIFYNDKSFASRVYTYFRGCLFISEFMFVDKNVGGVPGFSKLFSKRIEKGRVYNYKSGDLEKHFLFLNFEDVKIDDRSYKKCLKMVSSESYRGLRTDTVWFGKKIGLLKWRKYTGEILELGKNG